MWVDRGKECQAPGNISSGQTAIRLRTSGENPYN